MWLRGTRLSPRPSLPMFAGKPNEVKLERVLSPSEIESLSIVPAPSALLISLCGFGSLSVR